MVIPLQEPGTALFAALFLAGLRHGFDPDHIAAIADIVSAQLNPRRSLSLSFLYVGGHALVVLALGGAAAGSSLTLPPELDAVADRAIGITLVGLGLYVVYVLVRSRGRALPPSRWLLLLAAARRALTRLRRRRPPLVEIEHAHEHDVAGHHDGHPPEPRGGYGDEDGRLLVRARTHTHPHRHVARAPVDPFTEYGAATSFGIGMLHGVGAETPSQILVLSAAAGVAGSGGAFVSLLVFVGGLVLGNAVLAGAAIAGFGRVTRTSWPYVVLTSVTAGASVWLGLSYLFA